LSKLKELKLARPMFIANEKSDPKVAGMVFCMNKCKRDAIVLI